jgi:hypothetical protein
VVHFQTTTKAFVLHHVRKRAACIGVHHLYRAFALDRVASVASVAWEASVAWVAWVAWEALRVPPQNLVVGRRSKTRPQDDDFSKV